MTLRNPTPEQMHRRQMIMAMLILFGVPILNAVLQKYGLPPIVVPPQIVAPATSSSSNWEPYTVPPLLTALVAATEPTPCAIESATPVRAFTKALRQQRKHGILKRIRERRHSSASPTVDQHAPQPAVEAPAKCSKGICSWSESPHL